MLFQNLFERNIILKIVEPVAKIMFQLKFFSREDVFLRIFNSSIPVPPVSLFPFFVKEMIKVVQNDKSGENDVFYVRKPWLNK